MRTKALLAASAVFLVIGVAAAPAAAAPGEQVDSCKNADEGPSGDAGPPSFVDSVTPDFLSDLFADLPVPGFVKGFFGAGSGC